MNEAVSVSELKQARVESLDKVAELERIEREIQRKKQSPKAVDTDPDVRRDLALRAKYNAQQLEEARQQLSNIDLLLDGIRAQRLLPEVKKLRSAAEKKILDVKRRVKGIDEAINWLSESLVALDHDFVDLRN